MVIVGKGKVAKKPYEMPYTGQKIYSIEELCYYIYNNIYSINEDFFQPELPVWLTDELDMAVLAVKLEYMIEEEHGLKDLVVAVLCSCDYYREEEVRKIVKILDDIASLPVYMKKKIKADNYLRAGRYGKALQEYRKLLYGSFSINFKPEEYGNILHNQGIAQFYTSSFAEAVENFKEAYVRNHNKESLYHFLWILLMQKKEAQFEEEVQSYGMSEEEIQAVRRRFQDAVSEYRPQVVRGDRIVSCKEQMRKAFVY